MADLIDEIKDDIQQEQYAKLWHQYSNYIIGLIIAVVLSTAVFVWWKNYSQAKSEEQGSNIYKAFIAEKDANSEASLQLYSSIIDNGDKSHASISELRKAGLLLSVGKIDEALGLYKDLADNKKYPDELRELAGLLYIYNSINNGSADYLPRLKAMADGDGVFRYSAKELLAFTEFSAGSLDEAKKIFQELNSDINTPAKIKDRSGEMIGAIETKSANIHG
jgi:hypothetical protein